MSEPTESEVRLWIDRKSDRLHNFPTEPLATHLRAAFAERDALRAKVAELERQTNRMMRAINYREKLLVSLLRALGAEDLIGNFEEETARALERLTQLRAIADAVREFDPDARHGAWCVKGIDCAPCDCGLDALRAALEAYDIGDVDGKATDAGCNPVATGQPGASPGVPTSDPPAGARDKRYPEPALGVAGREGDGAPNADQPGGSELCACGHERGVHYDYGDHGGCDACLQPPEPCPAFRRAPPPKGWSSKPCLCGHREDAHFTDNPQWRDRCSPEYNGGHDCACPAFRRAFPPAFRSALTPSEDLRTWYAAEQKAGNINENAGKDCDRCSRPLTRCECPALPPVSAGEPSPPVQLHHPPTASLAPSGAEMAEKVDPLEPLQAWSAVALFHIGPPELNAELTAALDDALTESRARLAAQAGMCTEFSCREPGILGVVTSVGHFWVCAKHEALASLVEPADRLRKLAAEWRAAAAEQEELREEAEAKGCYVTAAATQGHRRTFRGCADDLERALKGDGE